MLSGRVSLVALATLLSPSLCLAAPVTVAYQFYSTVSSTISGPLLLRGELNYDNARPNAPIAVVMAGYSPTNGNLADVHAQAQRLRNAGFFAISVAMRGRDASAGVRDSGGLEVHDIYDAVESVKDDYASYVDESNVHITGYSGGGGNVMSAIVRFPDYFRLGSSYFGMSDYGFDPVNGWYNDGAGGRTATLDQDIGNPNLGNPDVIDRYHARASNLAASNSRFTEVHLFVNDNEPICPLVNDTSFAQNGGSQVVLHVGNSAAPAYQDFNGNGSEDPGEQQLWPHGFPSANQQAAAEQWYLDRLLAGTIPVPEIDASGTLYVPGFLQTRHFEVWPGDGQDSTGVVSYSLGTASASFKTDLIDNDPGAPISVVVRSDFLAPAGALVEARVNDVVVDSFPAGVRRVFNELASGDRLELSLAPAAAVPTGEGGIWTLLLAALSLMGVALRSLRRAAQSERSA